MLMECTQSGGYCMGWIRSEEEALAMINQMKSKSKGSYITQGVSFNKDNERHMELLKLCLMHSGSFSGMVKEMLADKFHNPNPVKHVVDIPVIEDKSEVRNELDVIETKKEEVKPAVDLGNFVL